MTKNALPFLRQIVPGLMAAMGYNGRGVGMGTMMGQTVADAIVKGSWSESAFPVSQAESILFHRLRNLGVSAHVNWFTLLDHLQKKSD